MKKMSFAFFAEATLGKLAKWLRIMGFDTIYGSENGAKTSMESNGKSRLYLTRTRRIADRENSKKLIFIESDNPFDQLKEVVRAVGMVPEDMSPFSRCIRCNIPIRPIDKKYVQGNVPDHILETHHIFQTCTGCRRIYWPGSHTKQSQEVIKKLFE